MEGPGYAAQTNHGSGDCAIGSNHSVAYLFFAIRRGKGKLCAYARDYIITMPTRYRMPSRMFIVSNIGRWFVKEAMLVFALE